MLFSGPFGLDRVFNNGVWDDEMMLNKARFKTRMALWIKGKCNNITNYSVEDFKRCLDGIIRRLRL